MIGRILGSVLAGVVNEATPVARAFDDSGKAGDIQQLVRLGSEDSAPRYFLLDRIEGPPIDDGFVGVRDKKLRQLAVAFLALTVYRVCGVLFLQHQVACISDVGQNAFQAGVLKAATVYGANAFGIQRTFRFQMGLTVKEVLKKAAHDGGFLWNNDQSAVLPTIPKNAESPVWNTLFRALVNVPLDVFTNGATSRLRKRSEQRQQQLAAFRQCINSFFLEPNGNSQFLQATDGDQHVQRVAGEAGKALGQDDRIGLLIQQTQEIGVRNKFRDSLRFTEDILHGLEVGRARGNEDATV